MSSVCFHSSSKLFIRKVRPLEIIMSISKIIGLVIIASLGELHCVRADALEPFTVDQYLGVWYDVAMLILDVSKPNPITCQWVEVTMTDKNDGSFVDDLMVIRNGQFFSYEGQGNIIDSVLHIKYAKSPLAEVNYAIERFGDGDVMILHDMDDDHKMSSALVSRNANPDMIPPEARAAYEQLATEVGGHVQYLSNEYCQ